MVRIVIRVAAWMVKRTPDVRLAIRVAADGHRTGRPLPFESRPLGLAHTPAAEGPTTSAHLAAPRELLSV